jgi:hypothetical protein
MKSPFSLPDLQASLAHGISPIWFVDPPPPDPRVRVLITARGSRTDVRIVIPRTPSAQRLLTTLYPPAGAAELIDARPRLDGRTRSRARDLRTKISIVISRFKSCPLTASSRPGYGGGFVLPHSKHSYAGEDSAEPVPKPEPERFSADGSVGGSIREQRSRCCRFWPVKRVSFFNGRSFSPVRRDTVLDLV